mgnify:CR=1 FL=1|jgi:hypothetical protein
MTIKEKVLTSAKTSFAKYGLKKDELSKLVDLIVASRGLTDESKDEDVTSAITAVEPYVGMMQSSFNRAVSETTKKFDGWIDPNHKPSPPAPPTPPVPPTELTQEQVQQMIAEATKGNQQAIKEAVAAAIAPYKEKEERARLNDLFGKSDKLKDIPEQFRSRYQLDKEENLETLAQQCADDWTALKQSLVASGSFVEAPKATSPEDERNDFIKRMQGFSERNAPKE